MNIQSSLDQLILQVQKSSRYVGTEFGSIHQDLSAARLTFALAFPDTYEVGMSNLGYRLLYHALNDLPEVACERVFLPWPDFANLLSEKQLPLFTLESRTPVGQFDVLGISLQFELCYTSCLALLDLAQVPLFSRERREGDPLVVGGGPCAFNPEPVADFFDCFAIGEGEVVACEIAEAVMAWKGTGANRTELLDRLSQIPGVYVPSLFEPRYHPVSRTLVALEPKKRGYERVVRRLMPDLDKLATSAYQRPIVPFMQTVHDRLSVELQRGCTRGCRFCQVGMTTRPTRQRSPGQVLQLADQGLSASGYHEVGLLSLSSGDYPCLNPLLDDLLERWEADRVALSLPSLRTETMSAALAEKIGRIRKTGFTLAPEAATDRMRAVINKGNCEEDLLRAVESVFRSGWSLLKLYFMIGLPEERDEDVVAIAQLTKRCLAAARRVLPKGKGSATVNLAVSTFVPKPFTPFQWEPMITAAETRRRQALVTAELGGRYGAISFKPHDSRQSSIEGALALGDRRVATAILYAFRKGQRLDGWTEWFREEVWLEAFRECERTHGIGLDWLTHRRRPFDEVLPWYRIDCGVDNSFLAEQRAAASRLEITSDCVDGPCTQCGACDQNLVKNRIYRLEQYVSRPRTPLRSEEPAARSRVRIRYGKLGRLVALSHLETMSTLLRAIRRAQLPVIYSRGFHPKPQVSLGPALPVGVESSCEYIDIELAGVHEAAVVAAKLAPQLPEGIPILEARNIDLRTPSLSESMQSVHYRVDFPEGWSVEVLQQRILTFQAAEQVVVRRAAPPRNRSGKRHQKFAMSRQREINLKEIVTHLSAEGPGRVAFSLKADPSGSAKPAEVLAAVFGDGAPPEGVRLLKEGVSFARTKGAQAIQPRAPRYADA